MQRSFIDIFMAYPLEFRRKVIETRAQEGLTIAEAAERFGVGMASLVRWLKTPEPRSGRGEPATEIDADALPHDLKLHPDAYYHERAARLGVSESGIAVALARLGATYGKSPDAPKGGRRRAAGISGQDRGAYRREPPSRSPG